MHILKRLAMVLSKQSCLSVALGQREYFLLIGSKTNPVLKSDGENVVIIIFTAERFKIDAFCKMYTLRFTP